MPDLKIICKPCQKIDNSIKPRKVINRLPDLDMWTIAEDGKTSEVSAQLARELQVSGIYPSDISPYQTILEFTDISKDITEGRMPSKFLPIDTHIVEVSQLKNLIEKVPETISNAKRTHTKPFLNIHPLSYRKTWQYDDTGYNFIFDFLFSFNIFTQNKALLDAIKKIKNNYSKGKYYRRVNKHSAFNFKSFRTKENGDNRNTRSVKRKIYKLAKQRKSVTKI